MTETKPTRTPGPWTYCRTTMRDGSDRDTLSVQADSRPIIPPMPEGYNGLYKEADLRLIAAAPDLLEAAEEVLADHDALASGVPSDSRAKLRAAIAKAKAAV